MLPKHTPCRLRASPRLTRGSVGASGTAQVGKCCVAARERVLVFSEDGDAHMGHLKAVTRKLKALGLLVDSDRSGFGFGWAASRKLLDGDTRVGGECVYFPVGASPLARSTPTSNHTHTSVRRSGRDGMRSTGVRSGWCTWVSPGSVGCERAV